MKYISYIFFESEYRFNEECLTETEFESIKDNQKIKQNYSTIKRYFEGYCDYFAIHDKGILTNNFIQNFKYGMNNRWHPYRKTAFDPAIQPLFSGCLLNEKDLFQIQKVLVQVNAKYGEEGLKKIRGINLAHGVYEQHIEIFDPNNLYDLPTNDLCDREEKKVIVLDPKEYSFEKRALDALNCPILIYYPNENVKSALFSMPYLLYNEKGNFLDQTFIFELLEKISSRIKLPTTSQLEEVSFYHALEICKYIYLEKNLEQYQYQNNNPSNRIQRIKKISKKYYQES